MTDEELDLLAAQVDALSPPDRLRLAAGLMDARKAQLALPIIQRVADELGDALLLQRPKAGL